MAEDDDDRRLERSTAARCEERGKINTEQKSSVYDISQREKIKIERLTSEAPVVFMRSYCFRNAR